MKDRFRYLFKNFGLLMIGNFSSKILNFLLVPLYTATLTTEEYGAYDIVYDTILLLIPIISLNISDAIMRFMIDSDEIRKRDVISVANKYTYLACLLFALALSAFYFVSENPIVHKYYFYIILLFVCVIVHQKMVQVARGLEMIKSISISGVLGTAVTITTNIIFLVFLKLGLDGYFLASILSLSAQIIYLLFRTHQCDLSLFSYNKKSIETEMLKYSMPLMATTLSWYINSVADRYTVILFEGLAANGIYAVAYKIPAIMTAVQTIFIQSWQISAVKEFNSEEGKQFVNKTYVAVQSVMVILCSFTILLTRLLATILFQADFYQAWVCVPTLVFYVLFNTLAGTLGGIFAAVKDTQTFMKTAIIGALSNILLNFLLIWKFGILGAAVATAVSSIVIWALRLFAAKKYVEIEYLKNHGILQLALLVIQAAVMTSITSRFGYIIQLVIIILLCYCNMNEAREWIKNLRRIRST